MTTATPRWDLFCRVVDNYGDAGFCWRLARQLVQVQRRAVTLWIDRPDALARIVGGVDARASHQQVDGVAIAPFDEATLTHPVEAAIEAFGCGLPPHYREAMRAERPVWINLEYLSAETWVDGVHRLPSPHPPLTRWFFFPGFTAGTGGLLREPGVADADGTRTLATSAEALAVSLFCYPNRGLPALLDAWAHGPDALQLRVADGTATADFSRWLGAPLPPAPARIERGALAIDVLPFVTQPAFDRRLRHCALNIVRGEDSFVRAQWAGRPLVWHAYPQEGQAQRAKLDAFLARYLQDVAPAAADALRDFTRAFDAQDGDALARGWPALRAALPTLQVHAADWGARLAALPELSASLAEFVESRYN